MTRRALIMDGHIGCQLWQRAVLRKLGVEAKVLSLRKKRGRRQIDQPPLPSAQEKILNIIKYLWRHKRTRRSWSATDGKLLSLIAGKRNLAALFDETDFLVGAYPAGVGGLLLDVARRHQKSVIFNLANRFTQDVTSGGEVATLTAILKEIHQSPEHTLAVMGEYDYQYVRHYLGIEPLKLYTSCHHIPLRKHRPVYETVLLDIPAPPPPPPQKIPAFGSSQEMNWRYQNWCAENGRRTAWRFGGIREFYSNYDWQDLAKHPAAVIFPHSAYSITMAELYEMNIPLFVPSVDVLIQYGMPHEVMRHYYNGASHPQSRLSRSFHDSDFSMAQWLRFCYFYQVENAIVWDSPDDLFRKLSECDLAGVSEKMYVENKASREQSLRRWGEVINQHSTNTTPV